MAPANQLQRISDLVERLTPLASKTRGMKIEAEEWNTLVDVLRGMLEIEHTQEQTVNTTLEEQFAHTHHQHQGEVESDWLSADLQSRLQDGSSSISTRQVLADMDKQVKSLSAEVARLTATVEEQQKLIDRTSVSELDRSKSLRDFSDRFTSVENLKTSVSTLSGQVQSLNQNVGVVLDLRHSLSDAQGNPINVAKLQEQLTNATALRDNLKGVDGSLLRLKDFEVQIREIQDVIKVGGGGGLEGRLATLSGNLQEQLKGQLSQQINTLQANLLTEHQASTDKLRTDFISAVKANRDELEISLDEKVTDVRTQLNAQVKDQLQKTTDTLRSNLSDISNAVVNTRLADLPNQIKTAVASSRAELEDSLRLQITDNLKVEIQSGLADAQKTLSAQVAGVQNLVIELKADIPLQVQNHIGDLQSSLSADISKQLNTRLDQFRLSLDPLVNDKVTAVVTTSMSGLNQRVDTVLQQRFAELNTRIDTSVSNQLKNLPEVVSGEVKSQLGAVNLPGQLDAFKTSLSATLLTQVNQSTADLRAQLSTNASTISQLQSQVAVSQKDAAQALQRSQQVELKLNDTNNRFDSKFKTVDDQLKVVKVSPGLHGGTGLLSGLDKA
jgi:hypothetical protein